ncbi:MULTISPECIES: adenosylmethionine--8-amino-7-oxononanoate transaminase [Paracoccus]|uniref:adenosylmethionine--8-amino-7-oxononanoate transaminase n=1 Tax=Paracoccus TaxID=265 RepID=UPI001FB5F028|nr:MULTISPECIES: adenosylmethionine--8-amino-7-oxononanoate transaminase [Paracoccus]MCJ1900229.1 adenosylmethionine--8-amino-7-oxononanoate transaminase [Paracoccus versutus]MDF3904879.1 adenosylmethionine--8-amino-7-oxononanoate transaminase [Paracoccus sp. AS002]
MRDFDRRHLWHPYSSMREPGPVHEVAAAEGVWLTLADGVRMIDAMSSWWAAAHGHRHPKLVAAMQAQLDRLPHVMFGGLTHGPAVGLARRLVGMLPAGLDRIFYSDSGSVAVEVALKMAVQAQLGLGQAGRVAFASARGGYYGDTWKAMSLCDPETGMHSHFGAALQVQHFVPRPPIPFGAEWPEDPARNGLGAVEALFAEKAYGIAGFIVEPVVQGAGGMWFYHPRWLAGVRELCDRHGVLLILDEIATGFGRTGTLFAMERAGVVPDILCLGKALTGGMMSFAATVASSRVAEAISDGPAPVLMHGPTFMGNPLACAVACASLDLLAEGGWQGQVAGIEAGLAQGLALARGLPGVRDVRVLGAIGVIELREAVDMARVHGFCRESGVWLRPFGRLLYCMPPFVARPEEVARICAAMVEIAGWPADRP